MPRLVWFPRIKLRCDELLSNFAFKCNLRRYTEAHNSTGLPDVTQMQPVVCDALKNEVMTSWKSTRKAGRCGLKPVFTTITK